MDGYSFKKFEETGGRYETRITITSHNSIGFPTRFYEQNNISGYKYVVLYYDESKKAIGLQFTNNEEEKHKFTIIKSKKGYGGSVVATSFFKKYELDTKKYKGKYEWKKMESDFGTLFVIDLGEK